MGKYISFSPTASIPLFAASCFKKIASFIRKPLIVKKTNMPLKGVLFSPIKTKNFPHSNIKTCRLNGLEPYLVINFSNKECRFKGLTKLVLAHKMYGFPYYDKKGEYGISNRDNYVITGKTDAEFIKLQQFFSTKTALYLFEGTRYRMKYLEKYIFWHHKFCQQTEVVYFSDQNSFVVFKIQTGKVEKAGADNSFFGN